MGVGDEVREHLDQLATVSLHVASEVPYAYLDSRWCRTQSQDFVHHSTKVEGDDDGIAFAHICDEVLGERPARFVSRSARPR